MKKILLSTLLVVLSSLSSFGQIINDAANWPNAGWTLTGTHDALSVIGNPTIDPNFGYDDDNAGSGSTDILIATSPVIDITAAQATEPSLFVDYAYDYNLGGTFDLEYFDADLATWVLWNALPDNSASQSGYCGAIGAGTSSVALDISGFTANQLSNFQYRFNYDASSTWGWGFCMSSPTLYSVGCLPATGLGTTAITYTSADLTWDVIGGAVGYNIEWGAPGFTPGTGVEIGSDNSATNSVQASGLTANTTYEFYVQTDCGGSQATWAGPYTFFTGYCTPSSGSNLTYIDNFTTTGALGNLSNLATGFTPGGYADYTAQFVKGTAGSSFDFNGAIVGGTVGFSIWIDWNNDLVFDNATEKFFNTTSYGNGPFTGTLNIPALQADGDYRMRVTTDFNASNPSNPCAAASRAEFEDYVIRVVTPPSEPDTPFEVAGTPDCVVGTQIDIATTPVDPNVTWYWQTVNNGTSTTDPFTGPFTVMNNGTIYVNAYNSLSDVWSSTSDSIVITSIPTATPPPAAIADANPACNATQLNVAAAPGGYEYYWQGTNATGTSNAEPATVAYDVTASGTYYVAAFETATQCWSDAVGTAVTISSVVPNDPVVSTPLNVCSTVSNIPLNATVSPLTYTYTVNMYDSFGDGWNGNVLNIFVDGAPVLNATFTTGSFASATFDVEEGQTITSTWTTGSWTSECSFDIENESGAVIHSGVSTNMINYTLPSNSYTLEWYDAPGGTLLGTGSPFEAVGTSVIPTVVSGTYDFYVVQTTGCQSNPVLLTVNISDVLVDLTAINETCTNYANGSFSVDAVQCGTAPFTFSVDGGAFGPAPTDLTAGTYDIVVMDDLGNTSATVPVTIQTDASVIPPAPIAVQTQYNFCTTDDPMNIEVEEYSADCSIDVNIFSTGWGDFTTWELLDNGGGTVLSGGTYGFGYNDTQTLASATDGPYTLSITSTLGDNIPNYSVTINGSVVLSGTAPANNTTVLGPFGTTCTGGVASAEWYSSAAVYETTGLIINALGTNEIPTSTPGVYSFDVYNNLNGCFSDSATTIEVNVNLVNVELTPVDATCNNQANGSFSVTNVDCGTAPFTFSVDGGAFGPAPTDLLPGTYDIVVQDMNGDQSATYTITIGDALPPSLVYMETIEDDGGQVSWTANGSETQWYVEWGLPGFTPGTGTEIGSADALDTFWIITGLDENTNYDVYVSANCGAGETVGTWVMVNFTTACGVYGIPFVETFEDNSETRVCWENQQEVGAADWTYDTGSSGGTVLTAYQGTLNARFVSQSGTNSPVTKLISPRFDLSGQDSVALVFAYAQENWVGDQNITKVYVASQTSAWTEIQSYNNNVAAWTLDTLFLSDTVYQIAFEGINNWGRANVIDDVQLMPCTLAPGIDGSMDVCRADDTVNLNSVITPGENFGKWYFSNPTFIVDDTVAQIGLLPAGTHEFYYIVETPCAIDTTVAYITVFNASSAGIDGTINVCRNEPFDLYSGLGGLVDHGGTWYDPSNNPMGSSQLMASNIPGQFNYDYIVSNGVCGPDTANVVVNVSPSCDWLNIAELGLEAIELYPNPTSGMIYITNEGSTEVFSYELTDLNGKVISSAANAINGTDTTPVDLSKLEPGVYLIKVANDNVEHTFRVIKQ